MRATEVTAEHLRLAQTRRRGGGGELHGGGLPVSLIPFLPLISSTAASH